MGKGNNTKNSVKTTEKTNKKTRKESYDERIKRMAERLKISAEIAEKFKAYASTGNSLAILFAKKYSLAADRKLWVDIIEYEAESWDDERNLEFAKVTFTTYPRKTKPDIPKKNGNIIDADYNMDCAYATWYAANKDIEEAKQNGVKGDTLVIIGRHIEKDGKRTYEIESIKKM